MSAIWGCVDLDGSSIEQGLGMAMEQPLKEYKIDRYACETQGNVMMGCGIQFIRTESEREQLPVFDSARGIYFTADCLLDNRPELIAELCPGQQDIPDGGLLYLAYLKWRKETSKHLRGSFTYAVYEQETKCLQICVDHTQTRSLYYCRQGNRIYFGTLLESVLHGMSDAPALNNEWIVMFMAMVPLTIQENPLYTPYKGVKRVLAASYRLFFQDGSDHDVSYWSPADVKPLRLSSDEEYRQHFRSLMERCARDAVRNTNGNVGILLSSGMDSSAVAAFAAPILKEKGQRLHGYTYVPLDGYVQQYNNSIVTNEKSGVLKLCEMYPNILPKFMSCQGIDGFNAIPEILKAFELPYKSLTNLAWINELSREASADGCRIFLDGQLGNGTISYGDMLTYETAMIQRGRFIKAISALNRYGKITKRSRIRSLKYLASCFVPKFIWKLTDRDYLRETLVNREFAASLGIGPTDPRLEMNTMFPRLSSFPQSHRLSFNPEAFAHISDGDTKLMLKHGMYKRDITRDIRIYEFCFSVPIECFVNDKPATRRCVRSYMDDLLPPEILAEDAPRGRQSGDWLFRIEPRWQEIYRDLERVCLSPTLLQFIDVNIMKQTLEKFKNGASPRDEIEFMILGAAYMMGLFLERKSSGSCSK